MKIKKVLENFGTSEFESSVDGIIENLNKLKEKYKDYVLYIDINYYGECVEYQLVGEREETKDEENARLYKEKLKLEQQRRQDEKEFERLKQKLGKS